MNVKSILILALIILPLALDAVLTQADLQLITPAGVNTNLAANSTVSLPAASPAQIPTNGLWLQITNVADGTVSANLNNATDFVYAIWSSTNLASRWGVETEIFPGINTNSAPFTVAMALRNPLFLWASDWTGVTANGNQTPLWWFYFWFGAGGLSLSDTNLDSSGNTLLYDFQNGFDPNLIQFSISVTNDYVSASAPVQLLRGA